VRGHATHVLDQDRVVAQMTRICEVADPDPGGYRLDPAHPRIDQLIGHVVGLRIEITELCGRFKLSQELDDADRRLATAELIRRNERVDRDLVEQVTGLPGIATDPPGPRTA
jgi:L-ornithine N5-monooxygenase